MQGLNTLGGVRLSNDVTRALQNYLTGAGAKNDARAGIAQSPQAEAPSVLALRSGDNLAPGVTLQRGFNKAAA